VVKNDQVKLSAASGNRSGNLSDSSEQTELLKQAWRDSTADVSQDDGLTGFNSKHMSGIHAHIRATDDDSPQSLQRPRKRLHRGSGFSVAIQH
jgi:hypothetical protein